MILETDKYYIPNTHRNIVLPIAWREEFNIEIEERVLVGLYNKALIISSDLVIETDNITLAKVNKKGLITIPKMLDAQLESKLHQLLVDPKKKCFFVSPVN